MRNQDRRSSSFVERTLRHLLLASEYAAGAEAIAGAGGALQGVDPRVKVAGILALIVAAASSRHAGAVAAVFAAAFELALLSRIPIRRLAVWVWMPVLFFTGVIALPAIFLTPGRTAFAVSGLVVTRQGIRTAELLLSRAETAATLAALLVLTTPWPRVLRALRALRCPAVAVVILGMTCRYIFVMLQTALDMLESRKSRTVGILLPADGRRLAASSAGVLLSKSMALGNDVHLAMQSRGFRGEIHLLDDFRAHPADWFWLTGFCAFAAAAVWWRA